MEDPSPTAEPRSPSGVIPWFVRNRVAANATLATLLLVPVLYSLAAESLTVSGGRSVA